MVIVGVRPSSSSGSSEPFFGVGRRNSPNLISACPSSTSWCEWIGWTDRQWDRQRSWPEEDVLRQAVLDCNFLTRFCVHRLQSASSSILTFAGAECSHGLRGPQEMMSMVAMVGAEDEEVVCNYLTRLACSKWISNQIKLDIFQRHFFPLQDFFLVNRIRTRIPRMVSILVSLWSCVCFLALQLLLGRWWWGWWWISHVNYN